MSGLDLAKTIVDPEKFEQLKTELRSRREALELEQPLKRETPSPVAESTLRSPSLRILERSEIPRPPDLKRHVLRDTPLPTIWKYLNPLMLYGRHLGIKGGMVREIDQKKGQVEDEKARSVYLATERIKDLCMQDGLLNPRAVFQFFPAYSSGNRLNLEGSEGVFAFDFPRQRSSKGLCLSDYTLPTPHQDHVALFVVTAGSGVRERATELKDQGDYLASHILQALALETAEAYAEYLHSQLRRMWGFPDPNDMTMMERFQAKYRGKRYSFGYPACPRLDDQAALFQALRAKEIGVELTEGFMMDPEASVSAIVFHHPEATYFSVGDQDENRT
jgi:5-methyltetrahydrofolate--homocysteine methyltransferase